MAHSRVTRFPSFLPPPCLPSPSPSSARDLVVVRRGDPGEAGGRDGARDTAATAMATDTARDRPRLFPRVRDLGRARRAPVDREASGTGTSGTPMAANCELISAAAASAMRRRAGSATLRSACLPAAGTTAVR